MKVSKVCVCCGVCGSGKTSVGGELSRIYGFTFIDADDLHSQAAREKMKAGVPLTDQDRLPWLDRVARATASAAETGTLVAVACSALTRRYRRLLKSKVIELASTVTQVTVFFSMLTAPAEAIRQRLADRKAGGAHFLLHTDLVDSQLRLLEPIQEDEGPSMTVNTESLRDEPNPSQKAATMVWNFITDAPDNSS